MIILIYTITDFIPTPLKLQYVTFIKHLFIYIFVEPVAKL